MKKLMIVAAIVSASAFANAASMNWSFDYSYDASKGVDVEPDGGVYANGIGVFVFDANALGGKTWAQVLSAIASGDTDTWQPLVRESVNIVDGAASSLDFKDFVDNGSGYAEAYAVMFDVAKDKIADAGKFYASDLASEVISTSGTANTIVFGDDGDLLGSAVAANWTEVNNVPEPTSGLLLLLGVAGLALRRRRA